MFAFSSKLLVTNILERVNTSVMNVLLGRFYTKAEVGDYNQAYQWSSKVFYLMQGTLQQVAQPVFTNVADERERQLRILRKLVRFTAFLSFPMLLGLGLVSEEFIVLTIGEKWIYSAHLLRLLCISGAFVPVCSVLTNLLISRGHSGTYFWVTLCQCVTLVVTILALRHYGIRTMVVAYVVVYTLWALVWHFFVGRLTGYSLTAFLKDVGGFALIALAVMAVTGALTSSIGPMWLLLTARVVMAALLYYVVMRLLRVKILDECMAFIRNKVKR
jgi:O-antigen/teichoic acid export membrane protein